MMESKQKSTRAEEVYSSPQKRGGIINKLYPPGPKPGVKGRMKNHCRKFWWCDFLVFASIVLVVVLPIIYVAIPKIAQREINKSRLYVTSQEVTNPKPDSIHLKLESLIRSNSKYRPTVDEFRAALSLEGKDPFVHIDIPKAKANAEFHVTVDQDVTIASAEAFAEYSKVVLGSEEFQVHLDGKPNLHLGGLPTMDVNYNKIITMKGLNRLKGLNITSIRVLAGAGNVLPDGSNMAGTVYIPNPSVMTLDLGNVTMNLAVNGTAIGTTLMPNLVLRPGNNTVPMQARVDQLAVIGLVQSSYRNAILPLQISGNSSIKDGQKLQYYTDAISSNVINLDLNVGPALSAIGINVSSIAPPS